MTRPAGAVYVGCNIQPTEYRRRHAPYKDALRGTATVTEMRTEKLPNPPFQSHLWPLTSALLAVFPGSCLQAAVQLDTINVTATRTARTADETLASVTVITRDEIDTSQARNVKELLSGLNGISFTSYGGYGKVTDLHLRGTDASQLLVLIDGIRIGSASLGATAWQHLPLDQIERIEVVRGPQSHLYGPDAIGGVIQIFTRQGRSGQRIDGGAGYGTHSTFDGDIGLSGGDGASHYSLRLSHLESDGFNAAEDNNPDKDGYDNTSFSGSFGHRFDNGLELSLSALYAEGSNQYDGYDASRDYEEEFVQQAINGKLQYAPTDWWELALSLGESRDLSTNFVDGGEASDFETRIPQANWQNDFLIGDTGTLTAGIDFLRDEVDGSTQYSETSRDNTGLYLQYQTEYGNGNLNLGVRHDDNQSFGGHTTGNLGVGYLVSPGLRLVGSYGTAFKAPTFNDLYYQDPWGSNGNPDLKPEESESLELGLEANPSWGSWSLRAYRTEIDNLIQWVEIAPWIWQPNNVASARIDGLEASISANLAGWQWQGYLTLLDPRDQESGNLLPGRSKQTLRIDIDRRFGVAGIGASLRARSESYNDTANQTRIPGYGLLDLRADYRLSPDWVVRAKIDNLLDKQYQTISGYNEPGRLFFLSLRYEPE